MMGMTPEEELRRIAACKLFIQRPTDANWATLGLPDEGMPAIIHSDDAHRRFWSSIQSLRGLVVEVQNRDGESADYRIDPESPQCGGSRGVGFAAIQLRHFDETKDTGEIISIDIDQIRSIYVY